MSENIGIREYCENDLNFVISSWLKSYETSYFASRRVSKDDDKRKACIQAPIFRREHRNLIIRCLTDCVAYIACSLDDPDLIFGYIVADKDCVHFIYVKKGFRQHHIATALLQKTAMPDKYEYSHFLPNFGYMLNKSKTAYYNPYRFFRYGSDKN